MARARFIRWFREIGIADVALVGGKNASLGEMYRELTPEGDPRPQRLRHHRRGLSPCPPRRWAGEAIRTSAERS